MNRIHNNTHFRLLCCLAGLALMPFSLRGETAPGLMPDAANIDLSFAWESRYVSEGRDNLDGASLPGTTLEIACAGFTLGSWYASSFEDPAYTEWNGYLEYGFAYEAIEAYVGYRHLQFMADDADDNEVGGGVACQILPGGLFVGVDWYHSFEAEGSFIETGISGAYALNQFITLSPGAVLGFNSGYIPDGHDGANHAALSLAAAAALKEGVELTGYVAHTWGIDAEPHNHAGDELLKDFFYGGIALHMSY